MPLKDLGKGSREMALRSEGFKGSVSSLFLFFSISISISLSVYLLLVVLLLAHLCRER